MDQNTLLSVMTGFVIVAAIALVVQMAVMIGMYKATRAAQQRISLVLPKVENLVDTSQKAIEQGRVQIQELTGKTNDILDSARTQMARVDSLMGDVTTRARTQLDKAEFVLDDTLSRAHQTVGLVHSGVMRPLREIQGIAVGVKTALNFLAKGNRPSVAQATQDEEMFI